MEILSGDVAIVYRKRAFSLAEILAGAPVDFECFFNYDGAAIF